MLMSAFKLDRIDSGCVKQRYDVAAIVSMFTYTILCNIPFLQFLSGYWYVAFACVLTIVALAFFRNRLAVADVEYMPVLYALLVLLSSIVTGGIVWDSTLQFLTCFAMVFLIYPNLTEESRRSVYRCISYVICIVTGISLFLYLIIRFTDLEHSSNQMVAYSLGNVFQGRLFGILNNPNTLGPIAVVAVIITLYRRLVWKEDVAIWFLCCSVLVNLLCLYLSDSRAALVAGVACAGLALLSLLPVKARRICLIALVICLLLVLANLGSILTMLTDMTGRDWVTGSARTPMWEYSPTLIKQHPVFGFGTRAAYRAVYGDIIHPNGTHNLYIETTLLYGLVASIPLALTVLGIAMSAIRRFVSDGGQVRYVPELGLLIFLFFFVESFFETLLYQSAPFQILLFISMYECSRSYLPRFGAIGVQKDEK